MNQVTSRLIVFKAATASSRHVVFYEVDTGLHTLQVNNAVGYGSMGRPETTHEFHYALRFAKSWEDVQAAFKAYGLDGVTLTLMYDEPMALRITFDMMTRSFKDIIGDREMAVVKRSRAKKADEPVAEPA